jgi:hypothetical protein
MPSPLARCATWRADAAEADDAEAGARELAAEERSIPTSARVMRSERARPRAAASISAIVSSAAEVVLASGALSTTIPRRLAASRSMLSTPTPPRPIALSRVAARSSASSTSRTRARDQPLERADRGEPRGRAPHA